MGGEFIYALRPETTGAARINEARKTRMNHDHDHQAAPGQSEDIEALVERAVQAVERPTAEFALQFSGMLKSTNQGSSLKLRVDALQIAREMARVIVLDVVQNGIRDLTRPGEIRSETVLQVYEHACTLADRAVEEALQELRHHQVDDYGAYSKAG